MAFPSTVRYSTISRILLSAVVACFLVITVSLILTLEIFTMYQGHHFEPHLTTDKQFFKKQNLNKQLPGAGTIDGCRENNNGNSTSALCKFSKYLQRENARLIGKVQVCDQLNKRRKRQQSSCQTHVPDETQVIVSRDLFDYLAANLRDAPYPGFENYVKYKVAQLGLSPLVDVKPLIPEFGDVINDVLSFRYPITVPPCRPDRPDRQPHASNTTTANPNPTAEAEAEAEAEAAASVFVVINSAPSYFRKRHVIRQTWRKHLKDAHRERLLGVAGFAFTLGLTEDAETQKQIEEESDTYGDIIQIGISDFYLNMSMKVAGLFNWLHRFCATVDFVVKVDDDVYLNVRNLVRFVHSYRLQNSSGLSMFGVVSSISNDFFVHREGKWNISFVDWPWEDYPQYYLGPAVLIPGNTIVPLLAAIQTTPMMPFDDVYYTGICTEKAGIEIHHSSRANKVLTLDMPIAPPPCQLRRYIAWMTESENQMNTSHVAIEKFYRNATRCSIVNSKGITKYFDYSYPVYFHFQ